MSRSSAHHRRRLASIAKKRCRAIRALAIVLHEERLRRDPPPPPKPSSLLGLDGLWPCGFLRPWPYGLGDGTYPSSTGSIGGMARSLRP